MAFSGPAHAHAKAWFSRREVRGNHRESVREASNGCHAAEMATDVLSKSRGVTLMLVRYAVFVLYSGEWVHCHISQGNARQTND